jgi:hypothetical protein
MRRPAFGCQFYIPIPLDCDWRAFGFCSLAHFCISEISLWPFSTVTGRIGFFADTSSAGSETSFVTKSKAEGR